MSGYLESGSDEPWIDVGIEPHHTSFIGSENLSEEEQASIAQGFARAEHTYRFVPPEEAAEALRLHRESVERHLASVSPLELGAPRSPGDRLAVAAADFVAHLHDDLPRGPVGDDSEFVADRFLVERSEAEWLRLASMGRRAVDEFVARRQSQEPSI